MQPGEPSRTALAAARHRAAHQLLEQGRIFFDPLAVRILGEDPDRIIEDAAASDTGRRMRMFIAVRTRFAEDALATAIARGSHQAEGPLCAQKSSVTQLVVLGAGLDTYACRGNYPESLRIFEVDHPATQEWKRRRLIEASIPLPASLTFTPVDFENETLAGGLAAAAFDPSRQTFFTWLGVVPYLTPDATWSTLRFIAGLPGGAHVVFDYSNPPDALSPELRAIYHERAARVAALGEPWVNHFDSAELHSGLTQAGFANLEDLGPRQIRGRWFPNLATPVAEKGGHIVYAATKW